MDMDELEAAYNSASSGEVKPEAMLFAASGLRQFAESTTKEPMRSELIAVADGCPAGHIILFREGSGFHYFVPV